MLINLSLEKSAKNFASRRITLVRHRVSVNNKSPHLRQIKYIFHLGFAELTVKSVRLHFIQNLATSRKKKVHAQVISQGGTSIENRRLASNLITVVAKRTTTTSRRKSLVISSAYNRAGKKVCVCVFFSFLLFLLVVCVGILHILRM